MNPVLGQIQIIFRILTAEHHLFRCFFHPGCDHILRETNPFFIPVHGGSVFLQHGYGVIQARLISDAGFFQNGQSGMVDGFNLLFSQRLVVSAL